MELELVDDLCCLVVLLVIEVLLGKLFIEIVVDFHHQLHLVNEVEYHLCANTLHLSKCYILVLLHINDLLIHNLVEQVVEKHSTDYAGDQFVQAARFH